MFALFSLPFWFAGKVLHVTFNDINIYITYLLSPGFS